MRILFVTDFYPPETNAAATRVHERARLWVADGNEVTVLTSVPNFPIGRVYDGYRNRWIQREEIDGVKVVRVKTYITRNQGTWRRGFDFMSFFASAVPAGLRIEKPEVVMATSPNFFAGLAGAAIAKLRGRPFVLEIGDLWPAFVHTLGGMRRGWTIRCLEWLEVLMYKSAHQIVCLTESFRTHVVSVAGRADRVHVVLNGVDPGLFFPGPAQRLKREDFSLDDRLVVGYFGNFGAAQGLVSQLDDMRALPGVCFLLVGDGVEKELLEEKCRQLSLDNVLLVGRRRRDEMPDMWRLCDIALVRLKADVGLESAIPSKVFEAMAMGKPILLVAPEGDASQLVLRSGCGLWVQPGDSEGFSRAVRKLTTVSYRNDLGDAGLRASERHTRRAQASAILRVLAEARTGSSS